METIPSIEDLDNLRARAKALRDLHNEAELDLLRAACAMVKAQRPDAVDIALGSWDCPESPTGSCAYDCADDPCCDYCLFCEDPDERK